MLKYVGDPLGVLLVRFPPYSSNVFWMGQDDGTGSFQDIINGYPILPGGFHAHIFAMVFRQPDRASPQFIGECRESFAIVSGNAMVVR